MSQRRAGRAGGAYVQRHPTTGERIEHYVKRLGVVVEQVVKHFGRDVAEMPYFVRGFVEVPDGVDFRLKIAEKFRIALLVLFGIFAQKLRHMTDLHFYILRDSFLRVAGQPLGEDAHRWDV